MKWHHYLSIACGCALLSVAHAAVELVAVASVSGDVRFVVANAETRAHSGWLSLGDSFETYRLSRYKAAEEVLVLERDAESISLRLKHDPVEKDERPKRKVLSGDGETASRRRQIPLWIDGWGNVSLGTTPATLDEVEALFRTLAAAHASVELVFVHAPRVAKENPERRRATKNAVLGRAQFAGLKRWTSRDVEAQGAPSPMPQRER